MKTEGGSKIVAWMNRASVVFVFVGVVTVAILAVTNHPHRAVLLLAGLLAFMGVLRLLWPGRPWFASRHRIGDAIIHFVLAGGIWFLSPATAAMGQG